MENNEQILMEKTIKDVIDKISNSSPYERIEKMMKPRFKSCNFEQKSLTVEYDIASWELNPQGVAHGGIITTIFDNSFGVLTHYFADKAFVTTVELGVHFHKPIFENDKIEVTAKATHIGRTLAGYTGEIRVLNRNMELSATASSTFMILKEKKTNIF